MALDVPDTAGAFAIVDRLGDVCDFYKVGSELFSAEGPRVVNALRRRDKRVFLDLKFHDIPTTVRAASAHAAALGASLITVHASGGVDMVRAAVEGCGESCDVLAVTILTSLDAVSVSEAWGRSEVEIAAEVVRLARLAAGAGAHGVVCAGTEVQAVRAATDDALAVLVPGIRFADGVRHDQRRTVTPFEAAAAGARYLVIGRAVTAAADPAGLMSRVREEITRATATLARS